MVARQAGLLYSCHDCKPSDSARFVTTVLNWRPSSTYVCICIYVYNCLYLYYIYIEGEREREKERETDRSPYDCAEIPGTLLAWSTPNPYSDSWSPNIQLQKERSKPWRVSISFSGLSSPTTGSPDIKLTRQGSQTEGPTFNPFGSPYHRGILQLAQAQSAAEEKSTQFLTQHGACSDLFLPKGGLQFYTMPDSTVRPKV